MKLKELTKRIDMVIAYPVGLVILASCVALGLHLASPGLEDSPSLAVAYGESRVRDQMRAADIEGFKLSCDTDRKKVSATFYFSSKVDLDPVTVQGKTDCSTKGVMVVGGEPYRTRAAQYYEPELVLRELTSLFAAAGVPSTPEDRTNPELQVVLHEKYYAEARKRGLAGIDFKCTEANKPVSFIARHIGASDDVEGELSVKCDQPSRTFRIWLTGPTKHAKVITPTSSEVPEVEVETRPGSTAYSHYLKVSPVLVEKAYAEFLSEPKFQQSF